MVPSGPARPATALLCPSSQTPRQSAGDPSQMLRANLDGACSFLPFLTSRFFGAKSLRPWEVQSGTVWPPHYCNLEIKSPSPRSELYTFLAQALPST